MTAVRSALVPSISTWRAASNVRLCRNRVFWKIPLRWTWYLKNFSTDFHNFFKKLFVFTISCTWTVPFSSKNFRLFAMNFCSEFWTPQKSIFLSTWFFYWKKIFFWETEPFKYTTIHFSSIIFLLFWFPLSGSPWRVFTASLCKKTRFEGGAITPTIFNIFL